MSYFTPFILILILSGLALGAPAQENELKITSIDVCKPVTVIISILSQIQAPATSFCSSFISIPVKTITSATTITSIPKPITITSTVTITPRVSVLATTTITVAHAKRNIIPALAERDIPIPSYLTAFASSEISTACSCLSIIPSTTTVKATTTVIGSGSTIVVRSTITAAPVTVTVTVTTSATVFSSSKVTALTTVTSSSPKITISSTIPSSSKTVGFSSTVPASSTIPASTKIITTLSTIVSSTKGIATSSTVPSSSTVPTSTVGPATTTMVPATSTTVPASSTFPVVPTILTTTTLSISSTAPATTTAPASSTLSCFVINAADDPLGDYDTFSDNSGFLVFNDEHDIFAATLLALTPDGTLMIPSQEIIATFNTDPSIEQFGQPIVFGAFSESYLSCSIATGVLTCSGTSDDGTVSSQLQLCPDSSDPGYDLSIGLSVAAGCTTPDLDVTILDCSTP